MLLPAPVYVKPGEQKALRARQGAPADNLRPAGPAVVPGVL